MTQPSPNPHPKSSTTPDCDTLDQLPLSALLYHVLVGPGSPFRLLPNPTN